MPHALAPAGKDPTGDRAPTGGSRSCRASRPAGSSPHGKRALAARRAPVRRAVVLRLRRQPRAPPARVRRRLGVRDPDGPRGRQRDRARTCRATRTRPSSRRDPERRVRDVRARHPGPALGVPEVLALVAAGLDELEELLVGDVVHRRSRSRARPPCGAGTRCPSRSDLVALGAERRAAGRDPDHPGFGGAARGPGTGAGLPSRAPPSGRREAGATCSGASPGASSSCSRIVNSAWPRARDAGCSSPSSGPRRGSRPRSRASARRAVRADRPRATATRRRGPPASASSSGSMPRSKSFSKPASIPGSPSARFQSVFTPNAGRCPS